MKLSDLIRDESHGGMSSTKVWLHIGNAAMTIGFLRAVWVGSATDAMALLFAAFGGVVTGSRVASKFLGLRSGSKPENGTEAPK